ncbi:MAG: dUTP diphosphatase [Thermoanaerobacteraceae bacterium]|nr:dUTP diphosphatase [Thermoanaerobacteraceae bacterium]
MSLKLPVKQLEHGSGLPLPQYMSPEAAGMDLYAACADKIVIDPQSICLVPTGISIAIPSGYEAQIRPRSGLALKYGLTLVNTPGTIDADYRGEIKLIMINLGKESVTINRGDRVAQMVICPVARVKPVLVERLDETVRGAGGFGHTGK